LIRKILDYKYGRDTLEPVQDLFKHETDQLILLQESTHFSVVSSGFLGLEDLIRPFTRSLECFKSYTNIENLPVVRWYHTNTFYRRPKLIDRFPKASRVILDAKHSLSGGSAYSHEAVKDKPSRLVIPGPITLVSLVDVEILGKKNSPYPELNNLLEDSGRFLAQELSKLPSNYKEIQLDEPILVWKKISRRLRPSILQAYQHIKSSVGNKKTIVNTYFEDAIPILSFLLKLPVDGIGLDLTATNPVHLATASFEGKILQAGIINAENYVPTPSGDLDQSQTKFYINLAKLLLKLNPDELILTSNTGLEYLPKSVADKCLHQLSNIVEGVHDNGY
ncbi:MAG: hypothetical protein ACFFBD_22520, partial [Candidatus Hodarchaeota archaeon]